MLWNLLNVELIILISRLYSANKSNLTNWLVNVVYSQITMTNSLQNYFPFIDDTWFMIARALLFASLLLLKLYFSGVNCTQNIISKRIYQIYSICSNTEFSICACSYWKPLVYLVGRLFSIYKFELRSFVICFRAIYRDTRSELLLNYLKFVTFYNFLNK